MTVVPFKKPSELVRVRVLVEATRAVIAAANPASEARAAEIAKARAEREARRSA